jgi:hypothetical protein
MMSFQVHASGRVDHHGTWQVEGFRASSPIVMVLEEGSIWVTNQQGDRQTLGATGVVVWDTGDWVEYGSEVPARFKDYWAPRVSSTGYHPCGPIDAPPGLPPGWVSEARQQ